MPACGFPAAVICSVSKARSKVSSSAPLPTGTSPRPVHHACTRHTTVCTPVAVKRSGVSPLHLARLLWEVASITSPLWHVAKCQ
eukprot:759451-Amphidinium_carterae.1